MNRFYILIAVVFVLSVALAGCSRPNAQDEADRNYKGPGKAKPGAPFGPGAGQPPR